MLTFIGTLQKSEIWFCGHALGPSLPFIPVYELGFSNSPTDGMIAGNVVLSKTLTHSLETIDIAVLCPQSQFAVLGAVLFQSMTS